MGKNKKKPMGGHSRKKVWSLCIIILFTLLNFCGRSEKRQEEPAPTPTPVAQIDLVTYWNEHPEESPYELIRNARAIAVVVDATCNEIERQFYIRPGDECKKAIAQCIINRSNTAGFPNPIIEVCEQPNQWQGVTHESEASNATAKLIRTMLEEEEAGGIPKNCVFFCLTGLGIEFRDAWNIETAHITFISY